MSEELKPCQCESPILRWVHHQPPLECGKVYEVVEDPAEIALMELSEFGWSSLGPDGEYRSQEELSGLLVQVANIACKALAEMDNRRASSASDKVVEGLRSLLAPSDEFVKDMATSYEVDEFIVRNIIDHATRPALARLTPGKEGR